MEVEPNRNKEYMILAFPDAYAAARIYIATTEAIQFKGTHRECGRER